jgi:hypothetical protein
MPRVLVLLLLLLLAWWLHSRLVDPLIEPASDLPTCCAASKLRGVWILGSSGCVCFCLLLAAAVAANTCRVDYGGGIAGACLVASQQVLCRLLATERTTVNLLCSNQAIDH